MPDPGQLSEQEAARRRRTWLQERHAQARELVVVLLRRPRPRSPASLTSSPPATCNAWPTCSPTPPSSMKDSRGCVVPRCQQPATWWDCPDGSRPQR
jgi:hypothetical protein